MVFDHIEKLKQQYTDKYVVVDATRPELARFRDVVGQVKTVNMSGRALVEFLDYHTDIGWHDIDPDFLRVVDKPQPKAKEVPARKPPAQKPTGEVAAATGQAATGKKLSPLEMARAQGSAKKAAGGKSSTADILAAARGGKAAPPPAKKPAGETPAAKPSGGKPSTADILAAARGGTAKPQAIRAPGEVAAAGGNEPAPPASSPASEMTTPPAKSNAKADKPSMTVEEMLARCRERDAK
jgi:hypothetical protein